MVEDEVSGNKVSVVVVAIKGRHFKFDRVECLASVA